MIFNPTRWNPPAAPSIPASYEQVAGFIAWREAVEDFCTAMGCRCLLEHVDENHWLFWYSQGVDAEQAVMNELIDVAD